ncbi:MAG: hypothetical protein M1834_008561 [Cirrosporium novae-zelandiae]|nr:MAG: hypothetical protein M1834_008561 [Cirrosporium novae-zelandiae]
MVKRNRNQNDNEIEKPSPKRHRPLHPDRLSSLSDELLLKILSQLPTYTLAQCQKLSRRFYILAGDPQLWKAAYYTRFVRPRAARIPGIKESATSSQSLLFSSKLSKWLDDDHLVKRGMNTNWKRQYKLRHNWSKGCCNISEVQLSEHRPTPPLLVRLHKGFAFTVDSTLGLRAWSLKNNRALHGSITFENDRGAVDPRKPSSLAVDTQYKNEDITRVAVGFQDGGFDLFQYSSNDRQFIRRYSHPSSTGVLSAIAYSHPFLLTMTGARLLSLYSLSDIDRKPTLLTSLKSHTVGDPLSLSIRPTSKGIKASIAYAFATPFTGWTVGLQEILMNPSGKTIQSRLASAADEEPRPRIPVDLLNSINTNFSPFVANNSHPTSLSYTHPYILLSHADNTLSLYLASSTPDSLRISSARRLWGHTSSISGAYISDRGKAVSISTIGEEMRVWELEDLVMAGGVKARQKGFRSVVVKPNPIPTSCLSSSDDDEDEADRTEEATSSGHEALTLLNPALHSRGRGIGLAFQEMNTAHELPINFSHSWIGFNDEQVVVLKEKRPEGAQSLKVYDFR